MLADLFRRRPKRHVAILPLTQAVTERARALQHATIDPLLARARLADALRDASVPPPHPRLFDEQIAAVPAEQLPEVLRRVAVLTHVLRAIPWGAVRELGATPTLQLVLDLARRYEMHDLDLLRRAPLRAEELARELVAQLGVGVEGETPDQSAARRAVLDWRRLVAQMNDAQASHADKLAWLEQLHDVSRMHRRGKF